MKITKRQLRRIIREEYTRLKKSRVIMESPEDMQKLDNLVLNGRVNQALTLADALGNESYQARILLDKKLLTSALESQIEAGKLSDAWTYPGEKGSVTFMYDKKQGTPRINQGIEVKFSTSPAEDPLQWTMTTKAWINEWYPHSRRDGTSNWEQKMPQDHPLASGRPMPCSFEAIVDLFNDFKELCDDINPVTTR